MKTRALLQAFSIQTRAELRHNLTGYGVIILLFNPLIMLAAIWFLVPTHSATPGLSPRTFALAGTVGACSLLVIYNLVLETYQDRITGVLLRVRTLPRGALTWTAAKSVSAIVTGWLITALFLVMAVIFMDGVKVSASRVALTLAVSLLAIAAATPLGFILGAWAKDAMAQMLVYVLLIAVFVTSGAFMPLTALPKWVQVAQQGLPFYWAGHLSRWALLGQGAAGWETGGSFHPLVALGVLAAWTILGYLLAAAVIKRSFSQQSLSTLEKARSKLMNQVGV